MATARELADRQTQAMADGDIDAAVSIYHEDAVIVAPEGEFKGIDQIREYVSTWIEPFSDMKFDITSQFEQGSKAVDEWKVTATHSAPIPAGAFGEAIPASGKEINMRGTDICEEKDGFIIRHHIYYDQAEMAEQLGIQT